jgi:methylated-DNA-[protein]-cysteine S-methyltransferase
MSVTPEKFTLDRIQTPIGAMLLAVDSEARLRVLDFEDYEPRMRQLIHRQYGADVVGLVVGRAPASIRTPIEAYFAGEICAIEAIPVKAPGTTFQCEVWAALRTIPAGATLSYGALASQINRPLAVRAVGLANGANPIGVVVPCHRVIGADASLTGYGGGIERKRWLLAHEGVEVSAAPSRGRRRVELTCEP